MLRLEARAQPSRGWSYGSPLLALALTVVIGVLLFAALGKDPLAGLRVFFWEPIKSGYALGELTVKATPLLLIAVGLAVCFRSNVWNIGAEGQYVMGAIFAAGVALLADKNSSGAIVLSILMEFSASTREGFSKEGRRARVVHRRHWVDQTNFINALIRDTRIIRIYAAHLTQDFFRVGVIPFCSRPAKARFDA